MTHYFNASNRPIVYNDKGQIVGAGEWLETDLTDQLRVAIEYGEIVTLPEGDGKPRVKPKSAKKSE